VTPKTWGDCVKLHANCGGICRWVEAVETPGVGWFGECRHCGQSGLPKEAMVPVETAVQELMAVPLDERREAGWEESGPWDWNQWRLCDQLGVARAGNYAVADGGESDD